MGVEPRSHLAHCRSERLSRGFDTDIIGRIERHLGAPFLPLGRSARFSQVGRRRYCRNLPTEDSRGLRHCLADWRLSWPLRLRLGQPRRIGRQAVAVSLSGDRERELWLQSCGATWHAADHARPFALDMS
jgi:hypothetical protein